MIKLERLTMQLKSNAAVQPQIMSTPELMIISETMAINGWMVLGLLSVGIEHLYRGFNHNRKLPLTPVI